MSGVWTAIRTALRWITAPIRWVRDNDLDETYPRRPSGAEAALHGSVITSLMNGGMTPH